MPGVQRKISTHLPEQDFNDLALVAAAQPGAPSPGQYARIILLKEAAKGKVLRLKIKKRKK